MTDTKGFFDYALEACDVLEARDRNQGAKFETNLDFVTRALRESVALNRGIASENAALKQRLAGGEDDFDLAKVPNFRLLAELRRRLPK